MGKLKLDDFKKYVKEEYNCDISTKRVLILILLIIFSMEIS